MSYEMEQIQKWKDMPDWSEKLTAYSRKLSITELNTHIAIVKAQMERMEVTIQNPSNSLLVMYHHFLDRAMYNISQNLQNQEHDFNP